MSDQIMWTTVDDVEKIWIYEGNEYSHRLVTRALQGCQSFSFHITTFEPGFDVMVEGDGEHEVVLYCLEGDSRQILDDGTEKHFTPGMAMYQPKTYRFRHLIGPNGLKVAVCCSPPRS